jgi:hypothetical protein
MKLGRSQVDPYRDNKLYHKAALFREDGRVSALCFNKPHSINPRFALWTTDDTAVTCKKCRRRMQHGPPQERH